VIGIGITTRNRPDVLAWSLRHHEAFMPAGAELVIVDDASDTPYTDPRAWHSPQRLGVARAKNECLLRLARCEHVFLFDDDAYPVRCGWAEYYMQQGFAHVSHSPANATFGMCVLRRHEGCNAMSWALGVMYYFTRACLDVVGGYDARMGLWGDEHVQLSRRIHAAGLTPAPFLSPVDTGAYVHALDLQPGPSPLGWFGGVFESCMTVDEKIREQRAGTSVRDDLTVFRPVIGGQHE